MCTSVVDYGMDKRRALRRRHHAGRGGHRNRIGLRLAIALILCAEGVSAQTSPARPLLLGPVTLRPSIVLRDVGVDSNIRSTSTEPQEDFTFTAQPKLASALPLGPALFTAAATVGFVYYATYKDEQSINWLVQSRVEDTNGRLRPFVDAAFNQARDRTGYEIHARVFHEDLTLGGGAELQITGITSLAASYRRERQKFGGDERVLGIALAEQLDHTTDAALAGIRVALTPFTTISTDVEVQRDRFHTSGFRDADSLRVAPGVTFAPDAVIAGRIEAGFRHFEPRDPRMSDFDGLVASVHAASTLFGMTRLVIDATRDVGYSFDPVTPNFVVDAAQVTVSQRMFGPVDIIALGSYDQLRYFGFEGLPSERLDRTRRVGGGLGWRASPSLHFTLIYDVTERASANRERRVYQQRRLFASATYGV